MERSVTAPSVLRLLRLQPAHAGFDPMLRDSLVPCLALLPGLLGLFAGRIGPEDTGPRLVASIWASREHMAAGLGGAVLAPGLDGELADGAIAPRLDVHPVRLAIGRAPDADAGILRLVEGTTRRDALDGYVAAVTGGTLADRDAGVGPLALYLGVEPPDRFVTFSLWDSWATIEAATGADVTRIERTRHAEQLVEWSVEHYERIPGVPADLAGVTEPPQAERPTVTLPEVAPPEAAPPEAAPPEAAPPEPAGSLG